MSEIDHEYTKEIVCPYCGHEQSDSWEFGDDGEHECSKCYETFEFERVVTVEWSTVKKRCAVHSFKLRTDYPVHESKIRGKFYKCMECEVCEYQQMFEIAQDEYNLLFQF